MFCWDDYGAEFCTMQGVYVQNIAIGERLREERDRLGVSQTQFAGLGEASKRAQINYEKGESSPTASYLSSIAKIGADVQYIITGVRSASLIGDEALLLDGFRKMDSETKRRTLAMVYGGTPPAAKQVFHGTVHQAIEGGAVFKKSVKFDLSEKK